MARDRGAAAAAAMLWLAACSGGSSPAPEPTPSTPSLPSSTFSLSGTVTPVAATAADGDTNDPAAPVAHNDTPATAQALPGTATVGGWVSKTLDPVDWYRATLAARQVVTLQIAGWTSGGPNDLDLCVYTDAVPPVRVTCSMGTGPVESTPVAAAGSYLVQVIAYAGASNYVLTLAEAPLSVVAADTLRLDAEFVPGEVIVRFKDGAVPAAGPRGLAARAESVGLLPLSGEEGREMRFALGAGAARARAFAALGVPEPARDPVAEAVDPLETARVDTVGVVKALRSRPDVATADLNYVFHPTALPNDTFWSRQWDLPMMNLPAAWDVTKGAPAKGGDVVVAVVDTGVFLAHPDLAGKLVPGYDFISSTAMSNDGDGIDPNPDDPGDDANIKLASFHGTHVAGTIGAATNNGAGVAAVSWGAKIMPVRVLGIGGGTSADIIQAVRFAAGLPNASGTVPAQRADVMNLSFGCPGCSSATEQALYDAVRAAGVVVVAAAGNDSSSTPTYPASYGGVISVSAVGPSGTRAPYSNFGSTIDLAAPGGDETAATTGGIASTWVDASSGARVAAYAYLQGTSMASPHVAGVVALMKAVCPTLTPAQVDGFLASGGMTDDIGAAGRDDLYGFGLVNAQKAVSTAQAQCYTQMGALGVTPSLLDFPPARTALTLTTGIAGSGTLTGNVTATDDASWLSLAPPASPDGIGTWTATVSRTGLAPGVYSATVTFTAPFSSGTAVERVPVTLQVGGGSGTGDAGYLHVRLTDAAAKVVAEVASSPASGQYAYAFQGIPAGSYRITAGTDMDGDGVICGAGEACGAYPSRGAAATVDLSKDLTGLDFAVGFDVALGIAGAQGVTP